MIKAGYIQFYPVLGDIDKNIDRLDSFFDQTKDADLIVLPELVSTGYNFSNRNEALACAEDLKSSRFLEYLIAKAKQNNAFIVAGINEKIGDKLFNTTVLVGQKGYIGKYQKIHLFMNEKDIFETGAEGLTVFDLGFAKTAMLICFDYYFPEIWRIVGMKGADIVCHPSNLLTQNAHKTLPAQAFMNKLFIITANRIGTEGDLTFNGKSFICDPNGNVLVRANEDREEVKIIEFDPLLARDKFVTPRNHAYNDRHPDLYKGLL
jgi:predicted amidohydrolase